MISRRSFLGLAAAGSAAAGGWGLWSSSGLPISANLPEQVVGTYWRADIGTSGRDIPSVYNLIFLFHAVPETSGRISLPATTTRDLRRQLAELRERVPVVLTVGGARAPLEFSSRRVSERLVRSLDALMIDVGPVDGVDLNTYEEGITPDPAEYIWLGNELKDIYGSDFLITTPPAPWSNQDRELCAAMADAGVLDLASPQFYDGPGLAEQATIDRYRPLWEQAVMKERLGLGLGLGVEQNFMNAEECVAASQSAQDAGLRGVYLWSLERDRQAGWPFAKQVV